MEGLKRKKGSKGQSKLTDEQLLLLNEIIQDENLQTAKEVKDRIEKEFDVEYSIRSVERIMKKLGYSYTKPYKIYSKMPADAEELLKKKHPTFRFRKFHCRVFGSNILSKSGQ